MAAPKPNQAPKEFIRLLQAAMAEHPDKLSLNQVARRADISPAYLSFLLNGKRSAPSNDAISRLEEVLNIPKGQLNTAAGKPEDSALEFFRKEEAGPIMRKLAEVPTNQLDKIERLLEQFLNRQRPKKK